MHWNILNNNTKNFWSFVILTVNLYVIGSVCVRTCQNEIFELAHSLSLSQIYSILYIWGVRYMLFVHMVLIHLSSVQIVNAIALMALSLNADFSHSQKQPKQNQFKLIKFPTVVLRAINYITFCCFFFSLARFCNEEFCCFLLINTIRNCLKQLSLKVVDAIFMIYRGKKQKGQQHWNWRSREKKLIREHSKAI